MSQSFFLSICYLTTSKWSQFFYVWSHLLFSWNFCMYHLKIFFGEILCYLQHFNLFYISGRKSRRLQLMSHLMKKSRNLKEGLRIYRFIQNNESQILILNSFLHILRKEKEKKTLLNLTFFQSAFFVGNENIFLILCRE